MPRFVILTHDHPVLHWDLLLERGEHLQAWRLLQEPIGHELISAAELPDHRRYYLDYEGPVSGDRGTVKRWDQGEFTELFRNADRLIVSLAGERIQGQTQLQRVSGPSWNFQLQASGV